MRIIVIASREGDSVKAPPAGHLAVEAGLRAAGSDGLIDGHIIMERPSGPSAREVEACWRIAREQSDGACGRGERPKALGAAMSSIADETIEVARAGEGLP